MKKTKLILGMISLSFLCACSMPDNLTGQLSDEQVMDSEILEYREDASKAILENASADFIGHHPIEESFLFWVDEHYGGEVLKGIVEGEDYNDSAVWSKLTGESIHVLWARYEKETGIGIHHMERIIWQEDEASGDKTSKDSDTVIDISGDFTMADGLATTNRLDEQPGRLVDCFSDDLVDEMKSADLFVINNEFTYTTRGTAVAGRDHNYRSDPSRAKYLSDIGVDVASLANNHTYDFGKEGLLDTLVTLHDNGIKTIGAGSDMDEAAAPLYFISHGRKIAFVSASDYELSDYYTKEATDTEPGIVKTISPDRFIEEIAEADRYADTVICITHWGIIGNMLYSQKQEELAKAFVDAGADVIVGSHSHCLQSIEYIGEVPVYYGLGNYFFSWAGWMPEDYDCGLARIHIADDGGITGEFVPCRFESGVTKKVTVPYEAEAIYSHLENISNTTTITEEGIIEHR